MKKKIIGIVILSLLLLAIVALLICNWCGAFIPKKASALTYNHYPAGYDIPGANTFTLNEVFEVYNVSGSISGLNSLIKLVSSIEFKYEYLTNGLFPGATTERGLWVSYIDSDNMVHHDALFLDDEEWLDIPVKVQAVRLASLASNTASVSELPMTLQIKLTRLPQEFTEYELENMPIRGFNRFNMYPVNTGVSALLDLNTTRRSILDTSSIDTNGPSLSFRFIYQSSLVTIHSVRCYSRPDIYPTSLVTQSLGNNTREYWPFLNSHYILENYSNGYFAGNVDGEESGYNKGIQEGQGQGYQEGYNIGYNVGYNDGTASPGAGAPITAATSIVRAVLTALDIKLFGFLSILDIIGIVVVLGLVLFIIKLIRG